MDNQQERPSDLELGWLVGALESEGCLTIVRSKWTNGKMYYNVAVIVCNTNKRFIERCVRSLTGLGVGHHVSWYSVEQQQKYNRRVKRPMGRITIWGKRRVRDLLDNTKGLWEAKAGQANLLAEFVALPSPCTGPVCDKLGEISKALNQGILTDYTPNTAETVMI